MATEKRLIAFDNIFPNRCFYVNAEDPMKSLDELINRINNAPTVDAVDALEYDAIVNKLECLLCHSTGWRYSKAGYSLEDMERMVTDYIEECCEEAVAEAVVHGEWGEIYTCHGERLWGYKCSQCEQDNPNKSNYCPNCGAKMDGDGNG